MGFKSALRLGQKVVGGFKNALRIGKKVYNFFSGKRVGGKSTEAQDTYGKDENSPKSLSNEDFVKEEEPPPTPPEPPPKLTRVEKKQLKRERKITDANTPRQLPKAKGVQVVKSGVDALKEGLKVKSQGIPTSLAQTRAEAQRIKNISEAPSKKQFEKIAKHNRKIQEKLLKEARKRAKKAKKNKNKNR